MVDKILSIDLDGILCNGEKPITENINIVNREFEKGNIVIINTARSWEKFMPTEKWLKENNVKYNHLAMGKVYATHYIDDKNARMEDL